MFSGNPMAVLVKVEDDIVEKNEFEEQVKSEQEEKPVVEEDPLASSVSDDPEVNKVKINLKEVDRLLYTILAIENDCQIIPQGAMRLTENHEVARNCAFKGLPECHAFDLKKYSHFRNVQSNVKKQSLLHDDAVFQRDFLDGLDEDIPKGSWSIQKDHSGRCAIIRNHSWFGFTAYHKSKTNIFGCVYIGEGLRNNEL
jgi:radial spoke head protein 9